MNLDLTPEQWVIVDSLAIQDGQTQVDLGTNSFKNAPTISRIIDLLEKKQLVLRKREDNDRRSYKIYLTDKGKSLHKKVLPAVEELRVKSWEGLSENDYEHFLKIINRVFKNFE